ncbi:MAG: helix-turn-helix domain-containing protein [Phycisphaerales bacterium]
MERPSRSSRQKYSIIAVLKALADPVRLRIVRVVRERGEVPCHEHFRDIPKSTLSHHWRVLRLAGLVHQRGDGVRRLNSLRAPDVDARFPGLLDAVLGQAPRPISVRQTAARHPPLRDRL